MVSVLIGILIVSQLICFYFILLLNTKLSKFKDLEIRQDKLIREMDDAISVYLLEMREENDRLIKELSNVKQTEKVTVAKQNDAMIETASTLMQNNSNTEDFVMSSKPVVPKNIVKNAYSQHKSMNSASTLDNNDSQKEPREKNDLLTFEQQVLKLYKQGKSIDEIAKITQKGKTEVELFIKFHA